MTTDRVPRSTGQAAGAPGRRAHALDISLRWLGHLPVPSGGIRKTIILLLLAALIPLLAVVAGIYYNRYEERRAHELQANSELARSAAATLENYLRAVLHEELRIGTALAAAPRLSLEQQVGLLANRAVPPLPIEQYAWLDAEGQLIASGAALLGHPEGSARSLVQEIRGGREWAVSDPLPERFDGGPSFAIARGIRGEDGVLRGIVVALVSARNLDQALGIQRGGNGSIVIVDGQGALLYRYPRAGDTLDEGDTFDPRRAIASATVGKELAGTFVLPSDGSPQLGATNYLESVGWLVWAGRPEAEVMAPVSENLLRDSALTFLATLAAFLAALSISRRLIVPMIRLQEQVLAVGRGDLGAFARVNGPTEFEELAKAFNVMMESLQAREGEREVYVHTASHDLRTVVGILQAQAMLLRKTMEDAGMSSEQRQSVEAIIRGIRRMRAIVQDLLDSGRLEAGQPPPMTWPVDLRSFIAELLERTAGMGDGGIRMDIPPDLPPVEADPNYLERILMNLLTNSLKYSPNKAEVVVGAKQAGQEVLISVSDHGVGIAEDDLPYIFDRFYRAKGARKAEGFGLGLYITKMLVEAHRGRIWVESKPGQGSTFHFTLPLAGREA